MKDPLWEPGADIGNPVAFDAGSVAVEHGIDRQMQDEWAFRSQTAYAKAKARGVFEDEIIAFPYGVRSGTAVLSEDDGPRPDVSLERLAALSTVYGSPTVTAGNAPGISTGASAVLLMRRETADARGLPPLGTVVATASVARAGREIAVAPATATSAVLEKASWELDQLDLIEINEAFAAVPLTSVRVLAGGDASLEASLLERTNVNGGAIAVGHPPGASGTRLLMTAALELSRRGGGKATVAICGGLGQADAIAVSVP
jgi:acetyl-CoA C-acetyltransferase